MSVDGLEGASTPAVAVADLGTVEPRSFGIIRNDHDALRTLLKKLGSPSQLRVCYEAGPCGYVVSRFLQRLKIDCAIIAPSLIPRKPSDRVNTDRRDASSRRPIVVMRGRCQCRASADPLPSG
jgi:transposase